MADGDSLLDVFVRVLPQEGDLEAIREHLQNTVAETTRAFNQLGDQANALARRQDFIRNQGRRGSGPAQRSPEEEAARRAQDEFQSLRAQVGNDIGTLQKQLSSLRAGGLLTDLQGVREAFKEVSRLQINLSDGNAEIEIEQRIDQLLDLRRVLETIQERASDGGGTSTPVEGNLIAAQKQARNLKSEISIVRRELKDLRAPELKKSLESSSVELDRLIVQMREMDDTGLTAGAIEPYLAQLRNIRATVLSIGDAQQQVSQTQKKALDRLFDLENERLALQDRIKDFPPGVLSKDDRIIIQGVNNDLSMSIRHLDEMRARINGTAESWDNYEQALNSVVSNQMRLTGQFDRVRAAGVSFNTLSNNAYQLGQAFEDAAIGYQLNGIAGAVRGASNNVSFLLNDLSRIPAIQTRVGALFKLSEKASEAVIPAVSGIGAALAITVLPPMIEWLQTLNDIEYGFNDLADRIKRQFEDIDLEINVSLDEQELNRDLQKMESVRDVLERIDELRLRSEEIVFEVRAQVEDLLTAPATRLFQRDLQRFSDDVQKQVDSLQRKIDTGAFSEGLRADSGLGLGGVDFSPSEVRRILGQTEAQIGRFKEIQALIDIINQGVVSINRNAQDGILNANAIRQTRDDIAKLNERLKSTSSELTKSDKITFDKATESAKVLEERLNKLVEPARQFESLVGEQLTAAIDAADRKTKELAATQAVLRGQLEGTATEYDQMVLDVGELARQYQTLIDSTIKFYESTGVAGDRLKELRDKLSSEAAFNVENEILRDQNDIVEKLTRAEERLAELREKKQNRESQQINLDRFTTAIQEAALSLDETGLDKNTAAIRELTDEINRLQDALFKINQAQDAVRAGAGVDAFQQIALNRTPRQQIPGVLAGAFGGQIGGLLAGFDAFAQMPKRLVGPAEQQREFLRQTANENLVRDFTAALNETLTSVLKKQPIRIDKQWQPEFEAPVSRMRQ